MGWHRIARLLVAAILAITVMVPQSVVPAMAASGDRTLYLYHTHTGETGRFTFWRNGGFDKKVLKELNYFLRDWRTNEPTQMDPNLFNLIWAVYNEVGATQPVNIVSSYRSPKTNAMLASQSSGVADNSQHMKGKAMDFFIPGIDLARLRATAMKYQVGGVGYYPTSGSPFVHLDTGSVRAWPRMTKAQLQKVFPDGKTMHLPTDGVPLSKAGYAYAQAEWQKCHMVPCNGVSAAPTTMLASVEEPPTPARRTLVDMLFGGGQPEAAAAAPAAGPTTVVASIPVDVAPTPFARPDFLAGGAEVTMVAAAAPGQIPFSTTGSAPLEDFPSGAPVPAQMSQALMMATRGPFVDDGASVLTASAPVPAERALPAGDLMTAYAALQPDPASERALAIIISRESTASVTPAAPVPAPPPGLGGIGGLRTAAVGGPSVGIDALASMFDATFGAVARAGVDEPASSAVDQLAAGHPLAAALRTPDLVMPDLDHAVDLFAQPISVYSGGFAVMFDRDEADFDPATELGTLATRMQWEAGDTVGLDARTFIRTPPMLMASN